MDEADDVAQDIVLRAWRSAASVRSAAPAVLCAWLDAVARNVVIDSARRRIRAPFMSDIDEAVLESPQHLEDDFEAREHLRDVRVAISNLQGSLREPLLLQAEYGLSAPEIADRLGISAIAVRQRLARARRVLRG
ncbi:RNA polymerase sigma factor [Microbacterium sp. As-52]|uniref:RNA polymerase sigma factor n=1 Tax=Microbacterium sp. As-52 TaxID=3390503 RepID=UPI003CF513B2